MLGTGAHARTMLSCIVGVGSVDDGIEAEFRPQLRQSAPELRFAVIAPISGIAEVARILELIGFELENGYIELRSQRQCGIRLNCGIRGTPPYDRKKAIDAENLMAYHRKQARIDASRISQDDAAQRGEMTAQILQIGHAQKRNGGKRDRRDK